MSIENKVENEVVNNTTKIEGKELSPLYQFLNSHDEQLSINSQTEIIRFESYQTSIEYIE
jgi:hypothetical protein